MRRFCLAVIAAALAACGGSGDDGPPARPPSGMAGMTAGGSEGAAVLAGARAHLDSLVHLEAARLVFVRAAHDSLARHALEVMRRDMEGMGMPPDSAWRALEDSVRRDLDALPRLVGEAFVLRMRAHAGRLRRLVGMHERMIGRMPM